MAKITKTLIILFLCIGIGTGNGCKKEPEMEMEKEPEKENPVIEEPEPKNPEPEYTDTIEIAGWSRAGRFLSKLQSCKCIGAKLIRNSEKFSLQADLESTINGTWKLLLDFTAGDTIDYSCEQILYTFYGNGNDTVTVSSSVDSITGGIFKYKSYPDPFCAWCYPIPGIGPNLVVGDAENYCQVARSWLVTYSVVYYGPGLNEYGYPHRGPGESERVFFKLK